MYLAMHPHLGATADHEDLLCGLGFFDMKRPLSDLLHVIKIANPPHPDVFHFVLRTSGCSASDSRTHMAQYTAMTAEELCILKQKHASYWRVFTAALLV